MVKKYCVEVNGNEIEVEILRQERADGRLLFDVSVLGVEYSIAVPTSTARRADSLPDFNLSSIGTLLDRRTTLTNDRTTGEVPDEGLVEVVSPIPGKVVEIKVASGDEIHAGDPLFVVEAMKMMNSIVATTSGKIASIRVNTGQSVDRDTVLCKITSGETKG